MLDGHNSHCSVFRDRGADPCPELATGAKTGAAVARDFLDPVLAVGYRFGDVLLCSILNGMILFCVIVVSIYVTARTRRPWWAGFNKAEGELQ